MIRLEEFTARQCIKETTSLGTPRILDSFAVKLPFSSLIHYISDSQADVGIRGSNPLLQHNDGVARIAFIEDGYGDYGRARRQTFNRAAFIKAYRNQQRGMSYFSTPERALAKERELVVFDYSLLLRQYKYGEVVTRFYDQWRNITTALVTQINEQSEGRNHFIEIKMPDKLPSEATFKLTEDELKKTQLDELLDNGHFWIRELRNFMLGKEEVLKLSNPGRVYFVITEGRNAVILPAAQLKERGETQVTKLYDMFQAILAKRSAADTAALEGEDTSGGEVTEEQIIPGTSNLLVNRIANLTEAGKLTAAQARAMINIDQRFDQMESPFGEGTIKEKRVVTEKMKAIEPELPTVINKKTVPAHATKASSNALYADYINNGVYEADILNVLKSFSRAGVLIQDVKQEDKIDALNDGHVLKLKILPVNGKASTINLDMFDLKPDGTFKADGNRYALDAQKVD